MNSHHPKARGFTLIELMIVIAIIGILASVAVPQYARYTKMAKFSELITLTSTYKSAVQLCIQDLNQTVGCSAGTNGVPPNLSGPNRYMQSHTTLNGVITITATAKVENLSYQLIPLYDPPTNTTTWTVGGTCLAANYCRP
ncbi:MAG: prepilin-type N-terminal cleavage/methylation domain-containing protein [Granulosicoccus sp.]